MSGKRECPASGKREKPNCHDVLTNLLRSKSLDKQQGRFYLALDIDEC
jgi:hypothetical protein